jgi:hypothetical protein
MPETATATALIARIDGTQIRLAALASSAPPPGPGTTPVGNEAEWDAGQVWSHVAELTPYWIGEARRIVASRGDTPVAFGRVPEDGIRDSAIESGRYRSTAEQWRAIVAGLDEFRTYVRSLSEDDWDAQGIHVRGDLRTVRLVLTATVADHLDDHASQLERLAAS